MVPGEPQHQNSYIHSPPFLLFKLWKVKTRGQCSSQQLKKIISHQVLHGGCKGLCKENKIPKIQDYYGSGWVGPGLTRIFLGGKSSQNSPKSVLIFWSSIPCVFCLHIIAKSCWLLWFECSVHVSDGFPKKNWMGGGWVDWALSNFFLGYLNFFNFAKP